MLFHLNKIISEASLQENYAIRRLQERFIVQTASQVQERENRVLTKRFFFKNNKIILHDPRVLLELRPSVINTCSLQVLFEEAVRYMEGEMEGLDQQERIEDPPRGLISQQL